MSNWSRIGVDIGGTFTDVAAVEPDGTLRIGKRLTTHGEEEAGVIAAVTDTGVNLSRPETILAHGTTLVINALLERKGARVALVTTKGFADIVELGRSNRPEVFNLRYRRDPVLVPAEHRFEIDERSYARGRAGYRPQAADLDRLAIALKVAGIDAVAVAFLNSYAQPENERYVADYLRCALPEIPVTASHELSREWREFERFTTAVANAYVIPVADRYIKTLEAGLADAGFCGEFIVLDSSGGAMSISTARKVPVRAVESGPVAGVLGARELAVQLDIDNLVTFDMGGTTAKTCLIEDKQVISTDLYWINGYRRGFPLQVRTVDIVEVGAGGGSIAWVDEAGRLRVGPRSAGSRPGPACYGLGGEHATVTDANLYCGHIDKENFGSSIQLDLAAASQAIEQLAKVAGLSPRRVALGILRLANLSMAAAVRRQTIERGRDPADFTLMAFGGGGPMHACEVAAEVGIRRVLVPMHPGHFSALGMLSANLRLDRREVLRRRLTILLPGEIADMVGRIAVDLKADLADRRRGPASDIDLRWSLALRYEGQEHTLLISSPFPGIAVPENVAAGFGEKFVAEYVLRFGHAIENGIVETVAVEVVVEQPLPRPLIKTDKGRHGLSRKMSSHFGEDETPLESVAMARGSLGAGGEFAGPMIIHEEGATTVVPPGASGRVLADGNLLLDVGMLIDRARKASIAEPVEPYAS
jgi:N-methylhydantoinase A